MDTHCVYLIEFETGHWYVGLEKLIPKNKRGSSRCDEDGNYLASSDTVKNLYDAGVPLKREITSRGTKKEMYKLEGLYLRGNSSDGSHLEDSKKLNKKKITDIIDDKSLSKYKTNIINVMPDDIRAAYCKKNKIYLNVDNMCNLGEEDIVSFASVLLLGHMDLDNKSIKKCFSGLIELWGKRNEYLYGDFMPFTPFELVEEVVDSISFDSNTRFMVLFNLEFVLWLIYKRGVKPENIVYMTDDEEKVKFLNAPGTAVYNVMVNRYMDKNGNMSKVTPESMRNFDKEKAEDLPIDDIVDVVIGNPPYGSNKYVKFFDMALRMAKDKVAFIMPENENSSSTKMKAHNESVERHKEFVFNELESYFPNVSAGEIHCVIASKSIKNEIKKSRSMKEIYKNGWNYLYPKRKRMNFKRGDAKFTSFRTTSDVKESGTEKTLYSIVKEGSVPLVPTFKYAKSTIVDSSNKKIMTPYFVAVNINSKINSEKGICNLKVGVFNTDDIRVTSHLMCYKECQTYEEAERIKEWLQSGEISDEVFRIVTYKNNNGFADGPFLNMADMNTLPYYE